MAEQTQTLGDGATGVQIDGNRNAVSIIRGGARLALRRPHARKAKPKSLIDVLRTDLRTTTFRGRADLLEELSAWCQAAEHTSVRCIVGPAGAGKTRLAIEVCEAAEAEGWIAAFVSSDELKRFHETQNLVHWALPGNVLLVLDYAATSRVILKQWLATLADATGKEPGGKLRLLLLERQADPQTGWWADLIRRDTLDRPTAADILAPNALIQLPRLSATADRRALFAETIERAAPFFDPPATVPPLPEPGDDREFDARLAKPGVTNEPLHLMMSAIHSMTHGVSKALALGPVELAEQIARIEAERLAKYGRASGLGDDGALITHLVACVTLQNGCPHEDVLTLVKEEMATFGLTLSIAPKTVADRLFDCMPSADDVLEPIRPDLIGEALVLLVIDGDRWRSTAESQAVVLRAYHRDRLGTIDTLVRCACDLSEGTADHASIRWLRVIVAAVENLLELMGIAAALPQDTVSMGELAADVVARIVTILRSAASKDHDTAAQWLGGYLNNLAIRLAQLDRSEDALAALEEAVKLQRRLATAQPAKFTSDLATSLHNLSGCLSGLGRPKDALAAAEEAARHRRRLAAERPHQCTNDLAATLDNLSGCLRQLGRSEAALAELEQVVELRRGLALARPDSFRPDLAISLNNLSGCLLEFDRGSQALEAAAEAVSICRDLAATRPDAFKPHLAEALNTLSACLSDADRDDEALAAAKEAVELRRGLVAARPAAFTAGLAASLSNLSACLLDLDQCEAALAAAEEAVQLRRALAATRPHAFTPYLARSLSWLSNALEATDRLSEAVRSNHEAIRLLIPYAEASPAVFAEKIACYARDYLRRCEVTHQDPDEQLILRALKPLEDKLE